MGAHLRSRSTADIFSPWTAIAGRTKVFGYRICRDSAALAHDYEKLMLGQVLPHIRKEGLTAAVYTQITDVEEELNGLMTYDREVLKIPEETLREINAALRFDA